MICVVGPTASGKTTLGVRLAQRLNGEVISADSMQLYRGMSIGTAAPTQEEMDGVPHHMIGVADPRVSYSVARYVDEASACADAVLSRGHIPVAVGGTGLYLDALVAGRSFAAGGESPARKELQRRCAEQGAAALLEELRGIDPAAAARLHVSDEKRILRALEVYYETGKTITAHNAESRRIPPRYAAVYLGLTFSRREDLWALIDRRVDQMIAAGLLKEVAALLDSGVPRSATAMQAIGYRQMLGVLDGTRTLADATEEIKLRSRQYAKRQLTWLRRNENIHWIVWEKERDFSMALQISTEILTAAGVR